MKIRQFIIIFLSLSLNCFAQEDNAIFQDSILNAYPSRNRNEIGLSIWFRGTPFPITYKRYLKDNMMRPVKAFRAGLGFYSTLSKSNNRFYTTYSSNLRIGREWYKPVHEKFAFYKGVDIILGHSYRKYKSLSPNEYSDLTNTFTGGVGPLIGLKFLINSRISLSTEIIPTVSVTYSESRSRSITSPSIVISSETTISVKVESVGVIYLHYNF